MALSKILDIFFILSLFAALCPIYLAFFYHPNHLSRTLCTYNEVGGGHQTTSTCLDTFFTEGIIQQEYNAYLPRTLQARLLESKQNHALSS